MVKEKSEELLVSMDDYVKAGISLGTKVITSFMKPYVYRRRPDGLATINTKLIDERLRTAINFLSK
jgi:small subunit ribosomal protein S2